MVQRRGLFSCISVIVLTALFASLLPSAANAQWQQQYGALQSNSSTSATPASGSGSATLGTMWSWPSSSGPAPTTSYWLVTAYSQMGGTYLTAANDWFGDPLAPYGTSGEASIGTHVVQESGSPVTISGTVTATWANVPQGQNKLWFGEYWAQPAPISLSLGGTTRDSSWNYDILVGQKFSHGLSVPSGFTASNFTWTVTGTKFQSWTESSSSSSEVDGPGALNIPTPSWYWNDPSPTAETVTCSATVTPPTGDGAAFNVTESVVVNVYIPNWSASGTPGIMKVSTGVPNETPSDYYLWAGPTGSELGGMNWSATIAPPAINPANFGAGTIGLCQLIDPGRTYTDSTGTVHSDFYNGTLGLDVYPVSWLTTTPTYTYNDNPGIDLTVNGAYSATETDSFKDYIMYTAPGSSQVVPLASFSWSLNGSATIPSTHNWANYTGSPGSITPNAATPFSASNTFPSWSEFCGNTIYE